MAITIPEVLHCDACTATFPLSYVNIMEEPKERPAYMLGKAAIDPNGIIRLLGYYKPRRKTRLSTIVCPYCRATLFVRPMMKLQFYIPTVRLLK